MVKLYLIQENFLKSPLFEIFAKDPDNRIIISKEAKLYFKLVNTPEEADVIFVPTQVSGLLKTEGRKIIKEHIALSKTWGKRCAVISNSDVIYDPGDPEVLIITPGPYASFPNQIAIPALLSEDPLEKWYDGDWKPITDFSQIKVGFCGQATENVFKLAKDVLQVLMLKWDILRKKSDFLYIPFFLAASHRAKLLKSLAKSKIIQTDFILRKKYKGGSKSTSEQKQMEFEFYQNIYDNLFTVCFRGFGNYSVRFYQTLAMGRIPVQIVTDSVLPFEKFIDYQNCVLLVPYSERYNLDKHIADFVASKTPNELIKIQNDCRKLWGDAFRLDKSLKYLSLEFQTRMKSNVNHRQEVD